MKWIACSWLFVCVFAPVSRAQMQQPPHQDVTDVPPRQLPVSLGSAAWPATPTPKTPIVPLGSTISVDDLRVPAAAKKELTRFQHSLQSGNMPDCVKHLTKAIHIYSQFAAAHQNLAACYVRLNEYQKAVAEFQTASEMDHHMIQPLLGLAGTFLVLGRYGDAESASRHALEIDPVDPMARYLLGRALAFEERDTPETEQLLRTSASQYPDARLALASLFLKRNAREEALTELRAYMQRPDVPERYKETIGCALKKLADAPASIRAVESPTPVPQN